MNINGKELKHGIIQGGMGIGVSLSELAGNVAKEGCMGVISSVNIGFKEPDFLKNPFEANIRALKEHIKKAKEISGGKGLIGVNIMVAVSHYEETVKAAIAAGADAIIAEGGESGGHVGDMTTMTLLPQVVAAVDVPVIAAGGIASGKQMAAAMLLGACGVQVGTCLLVSQECPIHDNYKQTLIKSKDNATTVTGRSQGAPVRIIKNEMAREYLKLEAEGADREQLEHITLGGLRRAVYDGDMIRGSVMAGQVCGQLTAVRPVVEILDEMVSDAKSSLAHAASIEL